PPSARSRRSARALPTPRWPMPSPTPPTSSLRLQRVRATRRPDRAAHDRSRCRRGIAADRVRQEFPRLRSQGHVANYTLIDNSLILSNNEITMKLRIAKTALKVADEVWIAVALLHREHPERGDFTIEEIVDRAKLEARN